MSHEIVDNMIAYKGEVPWHGLGYEVPADATGAEMLKIAKLDWKVNRHRIAMRSANQDNKGMLTEQLSGFRAIVRSDNDQVFQIASDRYQPVQNAEIVEFFREYCEAGQATMETVGGLKGGAVVWALAKLAGGDANIGGVDPVKGYMLLATSHDGSVKTMGKPTQVRVVCHNTLTAALEGHNSTFTMKHTRKWNEAVAAEAKRVMGMGIEAMEQTNAISEKLAKVALDGKGKIEFLKRLLNIDQAPVIITAEPSEAEVAEALAGIVGATDGIADYEKELEALGRAGRDILECMYASPGAKLATADGTMYGAIQGVTFYADHSRSRKQDTRLANAWFGAGARIKEDAIRIAKEMAGIK